MSELLAMANDPWPSAVEKLFDETADRFEAACQKAAACGQLPRIEDHVGQVAGPERLALLAELIPVEVHYRRQWGEAPAPQEYRHRFPELDLPAIILAMAEADRPPQEIWQRVDVFVQRFEEAWERGSRPAIDDFLPKEGPERLAVLQELVHVDLE